MVHHEVAHASILSTYTSERRSIADNYSKQSVRNGEKIFTLVKSLNMAGVTDIAEARKNLHKALKDPQQREKVNQGIEEQREHFDNVSQPGINLREYRKLTGATTALLARASYWICVWLGSATCSRLTLPAQVRCRSSSTSCLDLLQRLSSTSVIRNTPKADRCLLRQGAQCCSN